MPMGAGLAAEDEEIQEFGVDEALCDVSYLSFGSAIMDGRSVLGSRRP